MSIRKTSELSFIPLIRTLRGEGVMAWYHWPVRCSVLLFGILFFVVFGFVFLREEQVSDWQNVFVRAAHQLQAREPIHRPGDNSTI